MYWEFHQVANRPWVNLMEILLREDGYSYIITKSRCCCAFCRGLRTVRGEPLGVSGRELCSGSCGWQQALAAQWWEAADGASRSKRPSLGTNPNQCRDWDYALATLKTSNNVGIVSSYGWCSSCAVGQPLWLRLPQMVFLLSAGAFQGLPEAGQSTVSETSAVLCSTQQELRLLGFKREELLGESGLLLCCLGFFGVFLGGGLLSCLKQISEENWRSIIYFFHKDFHDCFEEELYY